jgi:hypothetical protein
VGKHVGSGAWRLLATDGATLSIASGAVSRVTLEVGSRLSGSYMSGFDLDIRWAVGAVDPPDLGSPTEKSP